MATEELFSFEPEQKTYHGRNVVLGVSIGALVGTLLTMFLCAVLYKSFAPKPNPVWKPKKKQQAEEEEDTTPAKKSIGDGGADAKKGESYALDTKTTSYFVGLGWDSMVDVDGGAALMTYKDGFLVATELVSFRNQSSACGGVQISPDNTTGNGQGDDEVISINLSKIKPDVEAIYVSVHVYSYGQKFDAISGCYARLVDQVGNKELVRYELKGSFSQCGSMIMARLTRDGKKGWSLDLLGAGVQGESRNVQENMYPLEELEKARKGGFPPPQLKVNRV